MSQYTHVFARKYDTFIELSCYCRGSYIADALQDYAPWEKIRLLTKEDVDSIIDNLKLSKENYKESVHRHKDAIATISQFNNTVGEKAEAIREEQEYMEECQQELDDVEAALMFIYFIQDVNADIYVGCECGSDVTVGDIEKENESVG